MKTKLKYLVVGLLIILLSLSFGAQPKGAKQNIELMLDWFPNPDHVPLYVAKSEGFFDEQGLKVEIMVPTQTQDPLKLVASRKVDIAVNYAPSIVIARSQGLSVRSIGSLIPHTLAGVMSLRKYGVLEPADLKGKLVGVSVTPLYRVMLEVLASSGGVQPDELKTVNVGFNLVTSLLSGKVDAVSGPFRNYEPLVLRSEGINKDQIVFLPFEEYGVPNYDELVLITSDWKLQNDRDQVQKFVRAVKRGVDFTLKNPEKAFEVFIKQNPDIDRELNSKAFQATLPYFKGAPAQSPERWGKLAEFMYQHGLIKQKVVTSDLFINLLK